MAAGAAELSSQNSSPISRRKMGAAAVSPLARLPLTAISSSSCHCLYTFPLAHLRPLSVAASTSSSASPPSDMNVATQHQQPMDQAPLPEGNGGSRRWRPMCLYHTQDKCTMMDDRTHLEKFNHDFAKDLRVDVDIRGVSPQDVDYFLVLDLEGKVEILEFPVLLINAKTLGVVDLFHRFVRPTQMSEQRINEYIEGKYGKFGVDRVWHDTAIPFKDAIDQFESWLNQHQLWVKERDGPLNQAAFVTCGNWDVKTKIPQQCSVAKMGLPPYFMEWINLKDVYLNFYDRTATGMMTMMKQLGIQAFGSHHLGIDDTKNIARVVQRMLLDGAQMKITARRDPRSPSNVRFLFENRI